MDFLGVTSCPFVVNTFQSVLCRRAKPHRYQLRDARLLHCHAIQHWSDAHRLLAMRDEHKLRLHAHFFHQFGEAADVGLIEWRINFV